jgi:hypothetical protein
MAQYGSGFIIHFQSIEMCEMYLFSYCFQAKFKMSMSLSVIGLMGIAMQTPIQSNGKLKY